MLDLSCMYGIKLPIGQNLKYLDMSNSYLEQSSDTIWCQKLCYWNNSLEYLDASGNSYWMSQSLYGESIDSVYDISGIENLHDININNNNLTFSLNDIASKFKGVKYLQASHNRLNIPLHGSICRRDEANLIEEIYLSFNSLTSANISRLIENCENLKTLNLNNNNLDSNVYLSLSGAVNLTTIALQGNQITKFSAPFRSELDRARNKGIRVEIDLKDNLLSCGCGSLDFVAWIQGNGRNIVVNFKHTHCLDFDGNKILLKDIDFTTLRNHCYNIVPIVTSVMTCLALAIVIVAITIFYRYRYRLQYKLFKLTNRFRTFGREDSVHYEYDAFVSYCSDDRFWVHDVLMKTLEETYGFKLVIHYRDFLLGNPIIECIDTFMGKSRELIVVISEASLQSEWCRYELEHAHLRAIQRNKHVIIIKLGQLPGTIDHAAARTLLDNYNFLEWKTTKDGQKLFWARFIGHLYGREFACSCCTGLHRVGYEQVRNDAL